MDTLRIRKMAKEIDQLVKQAAKEGVSPHAVQALDRARVGLTDSLVFIERIGELTIGTPSALDESLEQPDGNESLVNIT